VTQTAAEQVPWDEFFRYFRGAWRQGEHVSYIGPTGSGKTTLALSVLPIRQYVLALATKPKDATMDRLHKAERWPITPQWPMTGRHRSANRVILWPPFKRPEDVHNQQQVMHAAIVDAFTAGGWTIFADELFYLCRYLGLQRTLEMVWTQGRSVGITLVGGTQRPAHVPLLAYDQATHLFFWRDNDETNLRRIAGLGGLNSQAIRRTVAALPKHHALYLNTRTGETAQVLAPSPKG
jgi:energy-coupling factor transporter ATP-binding protein EcfA2